MTIIGTGATFEKQNDHISKLAFRNRFTFAERVAIETASVNNPTVRVMLKDMEAATYIDLSRQDTKDAVNALAQFGLITADKAYKILNAPVQAVEVFIL
jgi:hypothetical protein